MTGPALRRVKLPTRSGLIARITAKIELPIEPDGCWQWTGRPNSAGYGRIVGEGGRDAPLLYAHRVVYEILRGQIAAGMTLDHLCRNRLCVNPIHLEPVTAGENVLRGVGISARNARKTHCYRGHQLSGANLYINPASGSRICRACARILERRRVRRAAA